MRHETLSCSVALLALLWSAGCPLPEGERDSCTRPSDCLDGYVCNAESARCVIESETCSGGPVECGDETVLLAGQGEVNQLIVDEGHLYWTELGGFDALGNMLLGAVRRVPLNGGAVETIADDLEGVGGLMADERYVYWSSKEGVYRFDKSGGPELFIASNDRIGAVAMNAEWVYYMTDDTTVRGTSKAAGESVEWAFDGVTAFTVDDQLLYVFAGDYFRVALNGTMPTQELELSGEWTLFRPRKHGELLYAVNLFGNLGQMDVEELSWRTLVRHSGDGFVNTFVVAGDEVFASIDEPDYHTIVRASVVNPAPHTEVWRSAAGRGEAGTKSLSVAVDANYIYWADGHSGTIHRAPR